MVRADALPEIGGGHMMRCLTLASVLRSRGHDVSFVMQRSGMLGPVRDAGVPLVELDAAQAGLEEVIAAKPDWIVVDHYGLDGEWVRHARDALPRVSVLAMDDLDDRNWQADLVLDPARVRGGRRRFPVQGTLDGPGFALLRPEFAVQRDEALERRGSRVERVVILPGLMDAAGLAPRALDALKGRDVDVRVIMGASSQSRAAVEARVAIQERREVIYDAQDMAAHMVWADLCIGAGGGTAWERCALGLPTVAVAVAENQRPGIAALEDAGGIIAAQLDDDLAGKVDEAEMQLGALSQAAAALCDGRGAERVADAIEARLRPVTQEDARALFDWRNAPAVRAVSHSNAPLVWAEHEAWVARTLRDADVIWRIYSEGPQDVGVVRAVRRGQAWEWSFNLADHNTTRGAGGRMLARFVRWAEETGQIGLLRGDVRVGNAASEALHRRLGFVQVESGKPGVLVFQRQICDVGDS